MESVGHYCEEEKKTRCLQRVFALLNLGGSRLDAERPYPR
jgi:hypothetical protein